MYKFVNRPKSICLILGLVFLKIILLGCGKPPRPNPPLSANKIRINDVSQLNPTDVSQITNATQVRDLQRAIRLAKDKGLKISIAGKRHSQGGHAFYDDAIVLNMEDFDQILDFQPETKTIRVQSGVTWAQIQDYINPFGLAVKTMQSTNIFTIGGSLSSNIHGRDLHATTIIDTVRSFRLLTVEGKILTCSRDQNTDLFHLVIGGFGLFGVILDIELDLTENRVYQKSAILMDYTRFPSYFEQQFKGSSGVDLLIARPSISLGKQFMKETVVTIWQRTGQKMTRDLLKLRGEENVGRDRFLLNLSRKYKWSKRLRWYLQKKLVSKPGRTEIISRNNAMAPPTAPYELLLRKSPKNTDIVQEYFIPKSHFVDFMDGARKIMLDNSVNLLNVTIRYCAGNREAFLSHTRKDSFSIMFYTSQNLSSSGLIKAEKMTLQLVDLALKYKGTYYLTYQLFPTQSQIRQAYPLLDEFFNLKRQYDSQELLMNQFYRKYAVNNN